SPVGAAGAVTSIVITNAADAGPTLPAASLAFAVKVWVPAPSVPLVMLQLPPVATAVPRTVVPSVSYKVTVLPASAVPVTVGVVSLVILSVFEEPLSLAGERSGTEGAAGAIPSTKTPVVLPTLINNVDARPMSPLLSTRSVPSVMPSVSKSPDC